MGRSAKPFQAHPLILALLIGTLGGWLAFALGLPLAWMIGAMAATTAAAIARVPLAVPMSLRGVMVATLGVMLGSRFTPDILGRMLDWGASLAALFAYTVLTTAVGLLYFHGREEGSLTIGGDNTLDAASAAVEYVLAPGVEASLTGMYADWRTEGPGRDHEGFSGILGIEFGF